MNRKQDREPLHQTYRKPTFAMESSAIQHTDVIVCGCGPTGAMLSVLLSQYSIPHVVLERDAEISADPRGIALDEDGIRCLQACGIYDKIFTDIGQCESGNA